MKAKNVAKKAGITLLSIFIFYLLGRYAKISTGLEITYIFLQYPLLCIISILFGPVVGVITGITGHILIDLANSSYVWFSWVTGTGFLGLSLGLIAKRWKLKSVPEDDSSQYGKTRLQYALIILGLNVIAFLCIAPILEVLIYKATVQDAFSRGVFIALSNGLTSAIVTDIFFSSLRHTIIRRVFSILTLIDALVLVSYGNRNIGSILLYIITIVFGLYLFFYRHLHVKSKHKVIEIGKGILFFGFILYALEILFLAIFAYTNRPNGEEHIAIVLGAGLNGDKPTSILQMRLDTAYDWYEEDPSRIIITSGGQGDDELLPEGEAMRNYLIERGIPAENIHAECYSKTTWENFSYSMDLLKDTNLYDDSSIVIVTNNFHCFRASGYAKKVGFQKVKNLAAPTPVFGVIPNYLREGFAFIKYLIS